MRRNLVSILIAVVIGGLAGLGHINSAYAKETTERIVVKVVNYETETENKCVVVFRDMDIPEDVQIAAEKWGREYDICPELLESLAFYESSYREDVDSSDGSCKGLCQVNPKWHKARMERIGVTDLHDADQNMHVAADYLSELFEKYEDPAVALMEYNGDHSWKKGNTSKYASKILTMSEELEEKHGKKE